MITFIFENCDSFNVDNKYVRNLNIGTNKPSDQNICRLVLSKPANVLYKPFDLLAPRYKFDTLTKTSLSRLLIDDVFVDTYIKEPLPQTTRIDTEGNLYMTFIIDHSG